MDAGAKRKVSLQTRRNTVYFVCKSCGKTEQGASLSSSSASSKTALPLPKRTKVSYVEEHEQPAFDGVFSQAPPLQIQLERLADMEGGKKKCQVFGLAGFASQISGSSSSKGPTQRERELQNELCTVKDELSQVKELVSTLKAKTANYDVLTAKVEAFDAQMAAWMRMMQPPQFPSTSGPVHGASLPFSSTVAPMPRGSFTACTPHRPRPPHDPSDAQPVDSDDE